MRSVSASEGPTVPERVCLGLASSLWVLHVVQERFHSTSRGDFESTFVKAGDTGTRKGLG